jgi:hypothetical protein
VLAEGAERLTAGDERYILAGLGEAAIEVGAHGT